MGLNSWLYLCHFIFVCFLYNISLMSVKCHHLTFQFCFSNITKSTTNLTFLIENNSNLNKIGWLFSNLKGTVSIETNSRTENLLVGSSSAIPFQEDWAQGPPFISLLLQKKFLHQTSPFPLGLSPFPPPKKKLTSGTI